MYASGIIEPLGSRYFRGNTIIHLHQIIENLIAEGRVEGKRSRRREKNMDGWAVSRKRGRRGVGGKQEEGQTRGGR